MMTKSLSEVFFDRVIRIEAVQRECAEVAKKGAFVRHNEPRLPRNASAIERARHRAFHGGAFVPYTAESFFLGGCVPGTESPLWPVGMIPEPFPDKSELDVQVEPAMLRAIEAAYREWLALCTELREGRHLLVAGLDPRTGELGVMEPPRWHIDGLRVDVHASVIYQLKPHGPWIEPKLIKQVEGAMVTEVEAVYVFEEGEKPHIVWSDWWKHECDRRDRGLLPKNPDDYLEDAERRIKVRYQVNVVDRGELSRYKTALYAGETVRPTSTARAKRI
jgi:hypothetical protein